VMDVYCCDGYSTHYCECSSRAEGESGGEVEDGVEEMVGIK
jgi:hypothetical protein